ncbi:unnamed protein product [Sphenostylis stenocarpa]|uniref:Zinc finger PHD-type domain-containing protein n=1 Tax=Sphenostylis stenocarpa TaxID=92480 RepID=A0AA86VYR4_9FABA|nr:unnamed protein product [Sphenostylis stenocarpa]
MAKGTDSDEFVLLSRVRTGLKREFAFAMKAQSEICGGSLGRTRASKNRPEAPVQTASTRKRYRKTAEPKASEDVMSEEEAKSDVVDLQSDDEPKNNHAGESESATMLDCEEEPKSDVAMETVISEEEPKVLETIISEEEPKVLETIISEEEPKVLETIISEEEPKVLETIISEEEPKVLETVMGEEEPKVLDSIVNEEEPVVAETLKEEVVNEMVHPVSEINEESAEKDISGEKDPCGETLVLENDGDKGKKKKKRMKKRLEGPQTVRRFTRSALKVNSEETNDRKYVGVVGHNDGIKRETETEASVLMTTPSSGRFSNSRLRKFPTKLKDLLATGILDEMPVRYMKGSKARKNGETGLQGVIRHSGVLCFCESCRGAEVVTPTVFELHAGSANKRPPEYIYMDSGNCGNNLRDVMNACCDLPLESMEEAVQKLLGACKGVSKLVCESCILSPPQTATASSKKISPPVQPRSPETVMVQKLDNVMQPTSFDNGVQLISLDNGVLPNSLNNWVQPNSLNSEMKPTLLNSGMKPNSLKNGMKHSASRGKSQGRLTRKDLRLHKLVFEADVLPDGTEVAYYAHGQKLLVGYKKGYGIFCTCCNSEVSASQFEAHAGWASRRKPGTWYCKYCQNVFQKDRQGQHNVNALAAGRIEGTDILEQMNPRCIRVVKTVEVDHGGCALCSRHNFSKSFGPRTVIICDQCEKEYHVGCLKDHNMQNLEELPEGNWFCSTTCTQIHSALVSLAACGEKNIPDSLLSLIKKKHEEKSVDIDGGLDVKWRVINWKLDDSVENRKRLSKAVAIFHERFDPIVDSTSGRDFIPTMLFGRNIRGQDFSGMYCAVLTVNGDIVCAGVFRVFGSEIAELPLVATTSDQQGQGYFQCLFSCIETLLRSLNVKNLVLPAADEAESIWTGKFGFSKLPQDEVSVL